MDFQARGRGNTCGGIGEQIHLPKPIFYFAVIFMRGHKKWRSVLNFDTPSLKPNFHLKKLRILRV